MISGTSDHWPSPICYPLVRLESWTLLLLGYLTQINLETAPNRPPNPEAKSYRVPTELKLLTTKFSTDGARFLLTIQDSSPTGASFAALPQGPSHDHHHHHMHMAR